MDIDDLYYTLNDGRQSIALIFNHLNFKNDESPRHGTNEDCVRINNYFKSLGFDTTTCPDYTYEDIDKKLKEVSKKSNLEINCIVVVIMTHGSPDHLEAYDVSYPTQHLFTPFMDKNSLAGVPKLFFIQACRGGNYTKGYVVASDSVTVNTNIPFIADFLCMYSTYEGNVAYRDPDQGTRFIQALCKVLEEYYQNKELLQLLTLVVNRVAYRNIADTAYEAEKHNTQLPQLVTTLTKLFKFKKHAVAMEA